MKSIPSISGQESSTLEQAIADTNLASHWLREPAKMRAEFTRSVAADPATSPEILQELSQSFDTLTRQNVVANPNTPTEVLWKLGIEFPAQLLDNPIFSLLQLETPDLIERIPRATRISLLKCERVPAHFLNWGWEHCRWEEEIFIALATNPTTSQQVLKQLAKTTVGMRCSMSHHPDTPSYLLDILARDRIEAIRECVARNSNTPLRTLHQLATDYYPKVRQNVAKNPATHTDILEILATDEDIEVIRNVAAHPHTSAPVLERLATHPDDWVRRCTAAHFQTPPQILEALADDADDWVRQNVASHSQTPTFVLQKLVDDVDVWVRENLAANPKSSLQILTQLAIDPDVRVRQYARNRLNQTNP